MNKTLALPDRSPERGSNAPLGEVGLKIEAQDLELIVEAVEGLARATAELDGPQEVLDRIIEQRDGNMWSFTWPKDARNRGTTIIQGGGFQSIHMGGGFRGRMTVNGVDITSLVNGAAGEPLRATFRVPARSALMAKVDAGDIRTSGLLAGIRANTVSADVTCIGPVVQLQATTISGDIAAEDDTGPVNAHSTSGDVTLAAARGVVQAQTVSGNISVHAVESVMVNGSSVSGNVQVTAAPGAHPIASGNSVSGRVRLPH